MGYSYIPIFLLWEEDDLYVIFTCTRTGRFPFQKQWVFEKKYYVAEIRILRKQIDDINIPVCFSTRFQPF